MQVADAYMTSVVDNSTAAASEENFNFAEIQQFSDGKPDFGSSSVEEEEDHLSESEQCDSDATPVGAATVDVPEFKVEAPKKYMTAAEFDKVCKQLTAISSSYENSAKRYEKAIETTEKTIKVCQRADQKIDRFCRINEKMLNNTFQKIGQAFMKGQAAAAAQQSPQ